MEHIKPKVAQSATKPFHCTICPKSFLREGSLQEHILNRHVQDKEYKCKECFKSKQLTKYFATYAILNKHIKRTHGHPRFKCQVCFRTFTDSSNFAKHKRSHTQAGLKRLKCELCSKTYSSTNSLHTHLFFVHGQKREGAQYLNCELCSKEFITKHELELHVLKTHVVDKAFECSVCSKTFIDQETVEKHMKRHDKEMRHFCDVCTQGFKVKNNFVKHLGVKHKKFFYCDKCLTSFKNKLEFDEHISDSKQKLKCYICREIINSECNLKIHTNSHVKKIKTEKKNTKVGPELTDKMPKAESTNDLKNSRDFQCELCSKTFDRVAYLEAHRTLVHPNTEWKCNYEKCSKSYDIYSQLRRHQMTHAEAKEFVCNICKKSFYRPDNLRDHEQIHLAVKKFKCEMCSKSFTVFASLRAHIANNHGGFKPFKCPFLGCGTSWARNNDLKKHLVSHETVKSFKCEMCAAFKAFKSLEHLKIHLSRVHSDTKKVEALKSQSTRHSSSEVVFACSSNTCSFETVSKTEEALHYSQQHQLPKVVLIRESLCSSAFPLVSEKRNN